MSKHESELKEKLQPTQHKTAPAMHPDEVEVSSAPKSTWTVAMEWIEKHADSLIEDAGMCSSICQCPEDLSSWSMIVAVFFA
jgi:hypothetical protein